MTIFGYKLSLKKEQKKDIVFFDKKFAKIKIKSFSVHSFDYDKVNIGIFIQSLIYFIKSRKKITLKYVYLKFFLEKVKPKIVVGHNFNDIMFKLNDLNLNIKSIMYLHNRLYLNQITNMKKKYSNSKIDFFFVCDHLHKRILSKFISSKFFINGLTKNNEIDIKLVKKKFDIMIISEFRNLPLNHFYVKCLSFIARTVSEYAKINNLKVLVALNSSRDEKKFERQNEVDFFKRIDSKFYFNNNNSYQNAELSKLSICLASNLGKDLLARRHKVLFLPFLSKYSKEYKSMYLKKNSKFVHKTENKNEIFKKIDNLLNMKEKDWKSILVKSNNKFIFDKNNKIMKKLIKKIIQYDT